MANNFMEQLLMALITTPDPFPRHSIWDPQPTDNLAERGVHYKPEMSFTELRAIKNTHTLVIF